MLQPNNNLVHNHDIFNDIERTGEQLKQEFRKLSEQAQKKIESQVESAKFEAAYALRVSKENRKKTMQDVKEVRNDLWKQALDKANGDTKKALTFYDELCAFD